MSYSMDERETVLVYNDVDKNWDVYSTVPKHIRKITQLTEVTIIESEDNRPIAIRGKLNEKQVSMKKERVMTEEQRQKVAERLAKARENQR